VKKQGRMTQARLVPAVAGVLVMLTACSSEPPPEYDYITVCVDNKRTADPSDDVRLSDTDPRCPDWLDDNGNPVWDSEDDDETDASLWEELFGDTDHSGSFVYISTTSGYQVPGVGQHVTYPYGVTPTRPGALATTSYGTKVIPSGGTSGPVVHRGGFGASPNGSGGG
jgi:hypothetical protein